METAHRGRTAAPNCADSNLPMRNGNGFAAVRLGMASARFKSSYEEWKLFGFQTVMPFVYPIQIFL